MSHSFWAASEEMHRALVATLSPVEPGIAPLLDFSTDSLVPFFSVVRRWREADLPIEYGGVEPVVEDLIGAPLSLMAGLRALGGFYVARVMRSYCPDLDWGQHSYKEGGPVHWCLFAGSKHVHPISGDFFRVMSDSRVVGDLDLLRHVVFEFARNGLWTGLSDEYWVSHVTSRQLTPTPTDYLVARRGDFIAFDEYKLAATLGRFGFVPLHRDRSEWIRSEWQVDGEIAATVSAETAGGKPKDDVIRLTVRVSRGHDSPQRPEFERLLGELAALVDGYVDDAHDPRFNPFLPENERRYFGGKRRTDEEIEREVAERAERRTRAALTRKSKRVDLAGPGLDTERLPINRDIYLFKGKPDHLEEPERFKPLREKDAVNGMLDLGFNGPVDHEADENIELIAALDDPETPVAIAMLSWVGGKLRCIAVQAASGWQEPGAPQLAYGLHHLARDLGARLYDSGRDDF